MVETITPVVHGGRRRRWGISVALHALGATLSSAALGATLALVGRAAGAPHGTAGAWVVGLVALAYATRELFGWPVPIPERRKQVPEWWRERMSPGAAAFAYGLGLGLGFLTHLRHGTFVVVGLAAAVGGEPLAGAVMLGAFGLARGLAVLTAAPATDPEGAERTVERIERLSRLARPANAAALLLLAAASFFLTRSSPEAARTTGWAALALSLVFLAAAISKAMRWSAWGQSLRGYRLPRWSERVGALAVPLVELAVPALMVAGQPRAATLLGLGLLVVFSAAIIRAARIAGGKLPCGCFGKTKARRPEMLLARNAGLALLGLAALRAPGRVTMLDLRAPSSAEVLPALLLLVAVVVAGLGLRTLRLLREP